MYQQLENESEIFLLCSKKRIEEEYLRHICLVVRAEWPTGNRKIDGPPYPACALIFLPPLMLNVSSSRCSHLLFQVMVACFLVPVGSTAVNEERPQCLFQPFCIVLLSTFKNVSELGLCHACSWYPKESRYESMNCYLSSVPGAPRLINCYFIQFWWRAWSYGPEWLSSATTNRWCWWFGQCP